MAGIVGMWLVLTAMAVIYNNIGVVKVTHYLVGVTYDPNGKHLPPPPEVANLYLNYGIGRVRLHEADDNYMQTFRGYGIDMTFGISNGYLMNFAKNPLLVEEWFNKYVRPYIGDFVINHIVVGEKAVPGVQEFILPVMRTLQYLLNFYELGQVKVTTLLSAETVFDMSYPPSNATFLSNICGPMRDILMFMSRQGSPLLVSVYPHTHYIYGRGLINLEYAQFTSTEPVVRDGPYEYYNLFDAMIDAFYAAMEKLGVNDVEVAVGETGWSTCGHFEGTTPELASVYNQNFIKRISSGKGTPRKPNVFIQGFIRNVFDETYNPQGDTQCFGIFKINKQPKYPLKFTRVTC